MASIVEDIAAAARVPHREVSSVALAIEDDLAYACKLHDLAEWVDSARAFIDGMQTAFDDEPEFRAIFKARRLGRGPDWCNTEDDGRQYLSMSIADRLRAVARIAGLDSSAQVQNLTEDTTQ
jgi:uncharacterized protein (DUF736 family)